MEGQADNKKKETKHKSFRLTPDSITKLKEIADLFGRSETSMIEQIIASYYADRAKYFDEDRALRLQSITRK